MGRLSSTLIRRRIRTQAIKSLRHDQRSCSGDWVQFPAQFLRLAGCLFLTPDCLLTEAVRFYFDDGGAGTPPRSCPWEHSDRSNRFWGTEKDLQIHFRWSDRWRHQISGNFIPQVERNNWIWAFFPYQHSQFKLLSLLFRLSWDIWFWDVLLHLFICIRIDNRADYCKCHRKPTGRSWVNFPLLSGMKARNKIS